jgi:hypothetical protein
LGYGLDVVLDMIWIGFDMLWELEAFCGFDSTKISHF